MSGLLAFIEHVTPEGGEWCTTEKSSQLAALVLALRPRTIVEIGVFLGGSLVPMALAQQTYAFPAREVCWAVDPWAAQASAAGQTGKNAEWWGGLDHERIMRRFIARLERHEISSLVHIARIKSDDFVSPDVIDLLHIDGNHGEQAQRDVARFAPHVPIGGVLVMDDLNWEGGHVRVARDLACELGFAERYPLGTGCVMMRERLGSST